MCLCKWNLKVANHVLLFSATFVSSQCCPAELVWVVKGLLFWGAWKCRHRKQTSSLWCFWNAFYRKISFASFVTWFPQLVQFNCRMTLECNLVLVVWITFSWWELMNWTSCLEMCSLPYLDSTLALHCCWCQAMIWEAINTSLQEGVFPLTLKEEVWDPPEEGTPGPHCCK